MAGKTRYLSVGQSSIFIELLKTANVRVHKAFKIALIIFFKDLMYPQLRNHALRGQWKGYRSIDINGDWRAIYQEKDKNNTTAYFVAIGTHGQLYRQHDILECFSLRVGDKFETNK